MVAVARFILLTALRDRLFTALFLSLAVGAALSAFLGSTATIEQLEMTLVFAAGAGRFVLVLGLTIFAALHIQTMFESREVEAILSRAISRPAFVLQYWVGLAILATVLVAVFGVLVFMLAGSKAGALLWIATLIAECWIMLGVVLFAGLMLERASSAIMFTGGFYALARLMGFFVGIRDTATDVNFGSTIIKTVLDVVLLFVPRLDLFAQTQWLLRDVEKFPSAAIGLQTLLFLALILGAAALDLRRKQF